MDGCHLVKVIIWRHDAPVLESMEPFAAVNYLMAHNVLFFNP